MSNTHDNNFSILHWLGLTLVIWGHQYVLMGLNAPVVLGGVCHEIGLKILFVVSGYLVAKSFQNSTSCMQYMTKRVKRIFPPLILCVISMALVLGPIVTTKSMHRYILKVPAFIWKNILLRPTFNLPGVFLKNPSSRALNGSLWSLPVECFCYVILMVVGVLIRRIRRYSRCIAEMIGVAFFGVVYLLYALYTNGLMTGDAVVWGTDWIYACSIFVYFAAGSLIAFLRLENVCKLQYAVLGLVFYMVLPEWLIILRPALLAYAVISLALSAPTKLSRFLDQHAYYYAGYLWAFPIQQFFIYFLMVRHAVKMEPTLLFLISYAVIIGVAWIMTEVVDKMCKRPERM